MMIENFETCPRCRAIVQSCCGIGPNKVKVTLGNASDLSAQTRFEIAVLKRTRSISSWALRSIELTPSKSSETIKASGVGVKDIQQPSVVRIAEPANEVSTR